VAMSILEFGTKNDHVGEVQQQYTRLINPTKVVLPYHFSRTLSTNSGIVL
jgi:hypothetical protein